MAQHFLLSSEARELSLQDVIRMQENTAYKVFKHARWLDTDGEPVCPSCGNPKAYEMTRRRFRCSDVDCRKDFTVTSGTVFASRKLSFKKILLALLLSANSVKGKAALQLSREVDVSYKSAWVLLMKLREALSFEQEKLKLHGTVEIDGMYVNPHIRKANRREKDATEEAKQRRKDIKAERDRLVMAMRMRAGRIVTAITGSENATDANSFVKAFVDENAVVVSDQHPAYDSLGLYRRAQRTDHSKYFVGEKRESTNQVESFFGRIRRSAHGIHHRMSGKYLHWYICDIAWREDMRRRTNGWQSTGFLIRALNLPSSRYLCGYWQGNKLPGEILWNAT